MNLNTSNLSHPRTAWNLEAAMWQAIEDSRRPLGIGIASVDAASGRRLLSVIHDRHNTPGFSFWRDGKNVTPQVVKALRGQVKNLEGV